MTVIEGVFKSRGGSLKSPEVTWDDTASLILKIKHFPKALYDRISNKAGIEVVETDIDITALKHERECLMRRVAEIDSILAKQ